MSSELYSELVSIIMPTYNSEYTIEESIQSVLDQTYPNWELLITDDHSTDGTVEAVVSFNDSRIKLFRLNENSGAGVARNNSIRNATGRYIAFLDSDDIWDPNKLSDQILFMQRNNYYFTYTYYQKLTSGIPGSIVKAPAHITYDKLLYSNCIGCLTVMYDQVKLGKRYMPKIRKRQDMALWLELLKTTEKAFCLPKSLAMYRTDTGMTRRKVSVVRAQWHFYRHVVGLSFLESVPKMIIYSVKGLQKKLL